MNACRAWLEPVLVDEKVHTLALLNFNGISM